MTKEQVAAFIDANPDHHTIPILQAMLDDGLTLRLIVPGHVGPYGKQEPSAMVVLDDATSVGPEGFAASSLAALVWDADVITVNAVALNPQAAQLLADGARKIGRSILIETTPDRGDEWVAYINRQKQTACGLFALLPHNQTYH